MKNLFLALFIAICLQSYAQQIPTDYVARYDFTNNLANAVSGGAALTANNTGYAFVNDRNGQANVAIDFSGVSMSGHVFPATSSSPVNSFSVSVWLKPNPGTPGGRRGIVSLYSQTATSNAERFYIARESNNELSFFFRTEDGTQITASENIPNLYNGGWHNIVVTFEKNGANFDISVHVNGVKNRNLSSALDFQQANTNDNFLESNTVLELARTGIGTEQYSSLMDDLMLFDRAINTTEVYAINGQVLRYVNINATGDDNGMSWANAYTSMEKALANDANGQEIWVAKGNYYVPSSSTTLGFVVDRQVKIYGGFNGTETDIDERNYLTNKTVFSGDVQQNDNIANFPFNENETTRTDNAARVLHIAAHNVVLDGVVVRDGHSSSAYSGIGLQSGLNSFTLVNSEIAYNYSTGVNAGVGGAISVDSNYKINNNRFHHNSANTATGIYFYTINSPTFNIDVANNLFDNNRIKAEGNTFSGSAGWIRSLGRRGTVNVNFINNTLVKNVNDAPSGSGKINTVFGFSRPDGHSRFIQVRFDNNIFWGNTITGSTTLPKSVSSIVGTHNVGTMTISQKNISQDGKIATITVPSNDPLFTNVTTNDFTLQTGSPAIDTGLNSTVIGTIDVFGLNRIHNSTVDIGAHEYGSTTALSTDKISDNLVSIKLYPNPVSSRLTIGNVENFKSVVVYSLLGKQVLKSTSKILDVSQLTSGMYVVKIEDTLGKSYTKKFIKK